jgi:hypothetical protein
MSEFSYAVKSMEPWLVVVCTLCVLWLMFHHVRLCTSGFANPYPSTGGIQQSYVVSEIPGVGSQPGAPVYWEGAGATASGFKQGRHSHFQSEPPVFYPPIGEVQDALGSYTDMTGATDSINPEQGAIYKEEEQSGFLRNRSGFKRQQSNFAPTNLMKALGGA